MSGQWIESVTDWAIRITDWGLFPDWVSSHARLADPIRPMPNKGKSGHSGLPIALISRLPDWVVQSVLPIASPILSTGQGGRSGGRDMSICMKYKNTVIFSLEPPTSKQEVGATFFLLDVYSVNLKARQRFLIERL